jgi:hypothetical protein
LVPVLFLALLVLVVMAIVISSFSAYASLGAIDGTETSRPGRFDRDLDLEP